MIISMRLRMDLLFKDTEVTITSRIHPYTTLLQDRPHSGEASAWPVLVRLIRTGMNRGMKNTLNLRPVHLLSRRIIQRDFISTQLHSSKANYCFLRGAGYHPPNGYQSQQPPYGQQPQLYENGPEDQIYGPQITDQGGQVAQPYFEYSRCDGRRKALLVSRLEFYYIA
jgi:hypothetical protein